LVGMYLTGSKKVKQLTGIGWKGRRARSGGVLGKGARAGRRASKTGSDLADRCAATKTQKTRKRLGDDAFVSHRRGWMAAVGSGCLWMHPELGCRCRHSGCEHMMAGRPDARGLPRSAGFNGLEPASLEDRFEGLAGVFPPRCADPWSLCFNVRIDALKPPFGVLLHPAFDTIRFNGHGWREPV